MRLIENARYLSESVKIITNDKDAIAFDYSMKEISDKYYKVKIFDSYVKHLGGMTADKALKSNGLTNIIVKRHTGMTLSKLKMVGYKKD